MANDKEYKPRDEIDVFKAAYLVGGLHKFALEVERANRKDAETFKSIYRAAVTHFSVSQKEIAERIGYSKAAVCKWLHTNHMPPQPTREAVIAEILDMVREQLRESV